MKTIFGTSESDLHIRGWGRLKGQMRIQNWIEFFKAWELSIFRYYEKTDHDLPWWYTERANISFLAAAAWLCGGIAMEEYPIEKGFCGDNYEGRADLYLTLGTEGYAIEGKTMKVSLNFKDLAVPMKGLIETLVFQIDGEPYPMENADFLGNLLMAKVYHPSNGAVRSFRESHTEAIREYRRREFGKLFQEIRKRTAFGYRVDFFPKWVEPEHLLCSAEKYSYPGMTILMAFRRKGN